MIKKAHIGGVFWIYIQKKEIFLFGNFGFEGFKESLLQDDRKTLNKLPYGVKKFEKKNKKVTIVTLTFSMNEYKKIKIQIDSAQQHKISYIL